MLLDTSFLIALMRESNRRQRGPATAKIEQLGDTRLAIPLFALCELAAGARASARPEEQQRKIAGLTALLPVEYPSSENLLRRSGTPIPLMNLLIATLARCLEEPLLTADKGHFSRIPELAVETF